MISTTQRPAARLWRIVALLSHAGDTVGLRPWRAKPAAPPLRTPGDVARATENLEEAVWAASVLMAAAETGLIAALARPVGLAEAAGRANLPAPIAQGMLDVLVSLGFAAREGHLFRAAPGLAASLQPERRAQLEASWRAPLLQAEDFRRRARSRSLDLKGWQFTDPEVIAAQGELTAALVEKAVPKLRFLPGLTTKLHQPGARLLDVGAGAAGLSIALCRHFPALSAVALEPAPAPAAVGEAKIAEAGLGHRIELRRQGVEEVPDSEAYDLVFLPQMFLPDGVMPAAARNVFRALRPGGWLLAAVLSRQGGDRRAAVMRLRNLLWGGNARDDDVLKPMLQAAGFRPVIRAPGDEAIRMICARRPIRRSRLKALHRHLE